ncbi:unnamed protein product [Urochloa humidicola]
METDDAAASTLRLINGAIEAVRRKEREQDPVFRKLQVNACLAEVDPWDLPPVFVMGKESSSSLRTNSGYWKGQEDDFTAIRSLGAGSSSPSGSPSYLGVRRTLEFYHKDGTKTDWVLHEYQLLDPDKHDPDSLFLQEDIVIRKVFCKKGTDHHVRSCVRKFFTDLDNALDVEQSLHGGDDKATELVDVFERIKTKLLNTIVPVHRTKILDLLLIDFELWNTLGSCDLGSVWWVLPTASAAPDGGSEVWQHFTRIKTKDQGVEYAACHRCDKVLKAHSRNGTTHLKRHRNTCSCSNNPSNAADEKILRDLRATIDLYKQEKMEGKVDSPEHNTDLAKLDPWDPQLTPCYFTSSLSHETHQGHWKEISKERSAIRISDQLQDPRYIGLKRTLKFHHLSDKKMDYWIMLEYHQVDEYTPPSLLLEGSMVFRKVFPTYEDAVKEVDRKLNGDEEEEEAFYNVGCEEEVKALMGTLVHDCLLGKGVQGGQSRPGKCKRSEIWLHFTKIYTTDPDQVYAVCHCCDRGYEGRSKNGTSHLKRHNKVCSSKHRKV